MRKHVIRLILSALVLCLSLGGTAVSTFAESGREVHKISGSAKSVRSSQDQAKDQAPTKPVLKSLKNTSAGVKLTWSKSQRASGYLILRAAPSDDYYTVIKTVSAKASRVYTDKKAKLGKDYYYSVRAYRTIQGVKVKSDYNSYGTRITRMKPPVLTLKDLAGEVKLSWKKVTGAAGYYIYRKGPGQSSYYWIQTVGKGSVVSFSDIMVSTDSRYAYKVAAFSKTGTKTVSSGKGITHKKKQKAAAGAGGNTVYRAFLVGESVYQASTYSPSNPSADNDSDNLYGPHYDIHAMYKMLKSMNYSKVGAWENPSRNQILNSISQIFAAADEDDVSLFFYSGHGMSRAGQNSGALVLPDDEVITLQELANSLNQVKGSVIVILDSCGSGAGIDSPYYSSSEKTDFSARSTFSAEDFNNSAVSAFSNLDNGFQSKYLELVKANKFYVITAAAMHQQSWDILKGGIKGGALTRGLVKGAGYNYTSFKVGAGMPADKNSDYSVSLEEAWRYAQSVVNSLTDQKQDVMRYPRGSSFSLWSK